MLLALVAEPNMLLALVAYYKNYNIPIIGQYPEVLPNKDSPHRAHSESMVKILDALFLPRKIAFFRTRILFFFQNWRSVIIMKYDT